MVAESKGKKQSETLVQKSPAEFFAENKNIAGFDNPGKCLYTTIRELVENALDSAESICVLPDISITIEEVTQAELNTLRGIANVDRIDEALYLGHADSLGEVRKKGKAAKGAAKVTAPPAEPEILAEAGLPGAEGASAPTSPAPGASKLPPKPPTKGARAAGRGGAPERSYYRITVRDSGAGMAHEDIPEMLGRVLSGTKYGVAQTRGKFGLGAKMALIWSKMSTGLPITVSSAHAVRKRVKGGRGEREEAELGPLVLSSTVSRYVLDIDIRRNEPSVHSEAREPNAEGWHGAEVSVTIAGAWTYYRAKVLKYLQQIAVITPYTRFRLRYVPTGAGGGADGSTLGDAGCNAVPESKGILSLEFSRRTNTMPSRPRQVRHHPSSVDLELVRRLASLSGASSLAAFLVRDFDCVSPELADRILAEAGDAVPPEAPPKDLDPRGAARLHQLFHEIRFPDPDGRHLSPAGEYNLRLGILKEIAPDLVATCAGEPRVADGHAFVVEAALALGGREVRPGINVYRFANRIPLLFEEGSDVITRTARKRINWSSYKINQTTDRVSVFVSIVSTKIPFKGAGKEYIADDVEEIQHAVRAAIQLCCVQLKSKIVRQQAAREQKQRKKTLVKYVPDVARAVAAFLNTVAKRAKDQSIVPAKRPRLSPADADLIAQVEAKVVTEELLARRLTEHVERADTDMALEYQTQQGMLLGEHVDVYLAPMTEAHMVGPKLTAPAVSVRLLMDLATKPA